MPIFKTKSKDGDMQATRYVGVQMPQHISSFITLHSLAKGISKTAVINNILKIWAEGAHLCQQSYLIEDLTAKAQENWRVRKAKCSEVTLRQFRNELIRELEYKGLDKEVIINIVEGIK